ncbi:MAG TPA: LamG-like jellyroll fold domain-containing protein [Chitinophagaceae bacterium]|nr:LamG-like jellyroll fold domain-containing protein [Chitinophagaceae bacterium]
MKNTILVFLLLLFSFRSFPQVDLNNGLMAYYPFNGNANDASGNSNNAIFNNVTLTTDRFGNPNSAYSFNGTDNYIQIPNSPSLNMSNQISVCAWVRVNGFYQGNCHGNSILMKGDADYLPGNYLLRFDDGGYTNYQNCSLSSVDINHENFYGDNDQVPAGGYSPFIQTGQWYSVVYTSDGVTSKVYVNCELKISAPQNGITFTNAYDLFLGKLNDPNFPYWFNGSMDEVRIYDRALNEDEVKAYGGCPTTLNSCSNWLLTPSYGSAVNIGDLSITGNQLTVEADFYQTGYNSTQSIFGSADLVGKYRDPSNDNYLLRADYCSITTDQGFFQTPTVCDRELNKNYHVAMVYDGSTLKYYRNGFLMSQIPASGNLIQNSFNTRIGFYDYQYWDVQFYGYINEVRIWNVARTQGQIRTYMNTPLPSPPAQTGLLAYYTFDNLLNKQGNTAWNGTIAGAAAINQTAPSCSFVADSCEIPTSSNVTASFNAPDTVCVNTPVQVTNTSVGATSYYWNFCSANINASPIGANIGNPGSQLAGPVYIDYAEDNGNFYGFVSNNYSGTLTRLDFGNSLLNAPAVTNLGSVGGVIPQNAEGIQVINDQGNWYVFVVGGDPVGAGTPSKIVKIELGSNIANNSPVGTDWGNIGNLLYPHDLYIFNDNGTWYGITANYANNTITRFDFTSSFANTPTAVNLGNIGNLNGPTGLHAINDNGTWHVFVTNALSSTLSRLDFGGSLLSTPTGVNLGNINNTFSTSWDIFVFKYCGEYVGFLINADQSRNDLIRLNFGSSITNTPTAVSLGNIGNCDFPHCLSRIFRVGPDLYSFITNVVNNSVTRLQFVGCTNSSIPNSTAQSPPIITYNTPGIYNINLTIDDGLPTQSAYCKPIVVTSIDSMKIKDSITSCTSVDFKGLGYTTMSGVTSWKWDFGDGTSDSVQNISHTYSSAGTYKVKLTIANNGGCSDSITTNVTVTSFNITKSNDTAVCENSSVQLFASGGTSYTWTPASTLSNPDIANPVATPAGTTLYYVTVTNGIGCTKKDSVKVIVNSLPLITISKDTGVCNNTQVQLFASGGAAYSWTPAGSLNNPDSSNPIATPPSSATTTYYVTVTNSNGCSKNDSVKITTSAPPVISKTTDQNICINTSVQLFATGGGTYQWSPASSLDKDTIANPVASPKLNTKYYVTVTNAQGCAKTDSVQIGIYPVAAVAISDDTTICNGTSVQLFASGGASYSWSPASSLNNASSATPIAAPPSTTIYHVAIRDIYNCNYKDSVMVNVLPPIVFSVSPDASVCSQKSTQLSASGGDTYTWSPPDGLNNPDIANPVATPAATTTYTVTIHENTCDQTSDLSTTVTVLPLPDVVAASANDITCSLGSSQLNASGATSYLWIPATGLNNDAIANPVASPDATTLYTVTGTGINGCSNTDTVTVKVDFDKNALYLLPNSFTPNGDGLNDCFGVKYWGVIHDLDFRIYNRFGEMVFHTSDPNTCWNGTYNGRLQESAVFVYVIKASTACGVVNRKGTVTLLR